MCLLVLNILFFGQVSVFTRDTGSLAVGLEVPPDSAVLVRDGQAWLTPLLQSKGVSSLYLCGLVFELVAELAKEALKARHNKT